MKKVLVIACMVTLLLHTNSYAMSDITELGLTLATATMDSKNVSKGLEDVAKDKTIEWMWSSVGGLEQMILHNDEAEITDATNKLLDIVNIVQSVEKIAISITNGNYDNAAIEAMDQVVGKVNHPLVSATWSAVKLSYESHKLVISTEDARQVEILYNIVNHDRMLLGVSDASNSSPPQIPTNSKSADYFFNKYIMTNDSARRALKSYVTTVLNEEWPEQSWSDWLGSFRTIGMGIDTKKNAELEMLDREWRNKGRSWVIAVIKDINKQAKKDWAELKVRQEMVRFERFARSVSLFKNNDLPQMLRDFREIEKYKKELPLYRKEVIKSVKLRKKISQKISSLNVKSFSKIGDKYSSQEMLIPYLQSTTHKWQVKMMSYGSRAGLLRERTLSTKCNSEMNSWRKLKDDLSGFIVSNGDNAGDVLVNKDLSGIPYFKDNPKLMARFKRTKSYAMSYYEEYKNRLESFDWDFKVSQVGSFYIPKSIKLPSDPKEFTSVLLKVLNRGDIGLASHMHLAWTSSANSAFGSYSYYIKRASQGHFELKAPKDLPKYDDTDENMAKNSGWKWAKRLLLTKMSILYTTEKEKYDLAILPINQLMSSFEKLKFVREKQSKLYSDKIMEVLKYRRLKYDYDSYNSSYHKCINGAYKGLGRLDKGINENSLFVIPWILNQKANEVEHSGLCTNSSVLMDIKQSIKKEIDATKKVLEDFRKLPALTKNDIKQMKFFSSNKFDFDEYLKDIKEVEKNISTLNVIYSQINQMISYAYTDEINRDKDAFWLSQKAKDIDSFIEYILNSGKIKKGSSDKFLPRVGLEIVLPKGIDVKDGMLISYNAPIHYLSAEEIVFISTPLKALYSSSQVRGFLGSYFPKVSQGLNDFLALKFIKPAKENIIVSNKVVYFSDVKNLEFILSKIDVKKDSFDIEILNLPKCFPSVKDFRKFYYNDVYVDLKALNKSALGVAYLKQREKVKKLLDERRSFLILKKQEDDRIKAEVEAEKLENEATKKSMQESKKEDFQTINIQKIEKLYQQFAQYYTDKNLPSLLSLVSDDWKSNSDGTTLMDLEDTLDNSFSVFDEIKCDINSLSINPTIIKNLYSVNYVITIKGYIYDEDIEHAEKSSVAEEVQVKDGKAKIIQTLSGKYWKTR